MPNWYDITRDPEYQSLPEVDRLDLKKTFFNETIGKDPEFATLDDTTKQATWMEFMQSPDDTGEGALRSAASSFARGALRPLSDIPIAVGALTGLEGIERFGKNIQGGIESSFPVNPIQEGFFTTEIPGVAGQVASMLAGGGAGALGVKALGGTAKAAQLGAKTAVGTQAFAGGTAGGAASADVLGLKGGERIARSLLGGVTELASEAIPFGMGAETGLVRNLLGESVESGAGKILTSGATEAAEEGFAETAGQATDIAFRPEQASMDLSQIGKAMLLGGAGGGLMGAINNIGRPTPPESQTPIQQALAREINAIPTNAVPPQTDEEKRAGAEAGNQIIVDPQGNTAAVAPEMWNEAIKRQITPPVEAQATTQASDVEARLANLMRNPGLTAALNTADSIVTTAENTSSDVSQATTAARNIIQNVTETPYESRSETGEQAVINFDTQGGVQGILPSQPVAESNAEGLPLLGPELLIRRSNEVLPGQPAVTPSPAMEQLENISQTITDSNGEIAPEMSVLPPTVQAGAGVGEAIQLQPIETAPDAIQEQITDEGLLRQERPEMELQGLGEGNAQPQEVATEGQIQEEVAQPITPPPAPAVQTETTEPIETGDAMEAPLPKQPPIPKDKEARRKEAKEIERKLMAASLDSKNSPEDVYKAAGYVQIDGFWVHPHVDYNYVRKLSDKTKAIMLEHGIEFILSENPGSGAAGRVIEQHGGGRGISLKTDVDIGADAFTNKDSVIQHEIGHHVWKTLTQEQRDDYQKRGPQTSHGRRIKAGGTSYDAAAGQYKGGMEELVADEDFAQNFHENGGDIDATLGNKASNAKTPTAETLGATPPPAPAMEVPEGAARNADMLRQAAARKAGTEQGPRIGFLRPSEVAPATEAPPITPQGTPTPATEGKVMPGGSAIERETDEQKFQRIKSVSPSQRTDEDISFANAFSKRQKELKPQAGEATRKAFLANHTASIGGRLRKALDQTITFRGLKGTVGSWAETLYNEGWRMALDARGNRQFTNGTKALGSSGLGKVGMNYADFLSSQPQTTTVAAPTETAAPSAKEAAVASVVQQPVEGSIPTVEQESATTAIESTEKTDVAKEAMRFLEADLTDTQRAKWTPEMFTAAQAFFDSGGKDFDSLKKAIKFPRVVQQAYIKADKEAAAEQTRREAADAAMAREVEKAEKEQAKLEADQKQREELGLKTLNSLIEKTRTNVVQGTVKSSDANQAVAILNKSGAIPNVLFTWIGTSKDFLADPANRVRYPETWKAVSSNPNIEGMSENGQPIVFTDNVGVSDLDRNLAKLQGTTPEVAAVRRVILHENIHKGMFFLSLKDKMKLFQFLHRLYSPEELDQLAKSYDEYSDWRINQVSYFSIIEEAMTRDFDSMAEIPRDGIWAEFMQFLRDIWQKITGKTSEPTLKNYKDVFRLIRNSLKNSEKANADRLKNGGKTKYETNDTSVRPYASEGYGSQRMEGVSTGDNSPRAQAIRKAVSESNWNELSPTQRAKALEEFGIQSIQSRYSFDASILPVRVTNERTPKNRPASILSAGPSPAITIQFDTSGLADLLSGDAVTAFANVFDMAQEEVIHAAQHINIYNRWKASKSTDSVGLYELKHYTSMINEVAKIAGDELRSGNPAVANIFTNAWNLYNPNNRAADVNDAIGKIKSAPEAAAFAMELSRMMLQMQRQDFTTETGWMRFVEAMKAMLADITNALRTALAMAKNGQVGKRLQDEISEINALMNDLESASQPMASKVIYDSPNEAAFNSGAEVARNADYDERDKAVRSTIRAAYDLAPKDNGPSVPLDQLFDIAKQSMPDLTEGEFSQILQDLYEDSGALLQAGESPFSIFNNEGERAGSVIVMPPSGFQTRAMASIVDSPATNEFTQSVDGINNGTAKAAFSGRQFKDFKPIDRTVKSAEEYSDVAIKYVNNLEKEGVSLEDIANSVISPVFLESIGIEQDLMAQDALTIEVRQRVDKASRKEKSPGRKKQLSKLSERLSAFWQGVGSKKGQHLGQRRYLVNKARYSWMFIRELAEKAMKEARTNIIISNFGSENVTSFTQNSYENADMANQMAADENVNAAENDAEWSLIKEGVEILEGEAKSIWQRMAQLLRRFAFYARRKTMRAANAKASITDSERNELNAILQMSDEEAAKAEAKDLAEFIALGKRFLGEESDADTPEKKTVRKKREKMVEVAKKRADKGQPIDPAETANDIAIRLLNEFENKLAKSAFFNSATKPDTIVKAFREQISDPMDRKAFKDRLMAMEVTSEMADKLFDKAARTKDNAQWKRAQDMLEGPNALRNIIREINRARPGDQAPLSKQIPWRELLSQNAKTVEEYRQRIFDAISANEELKSATPDQKARLADLFAEAWESNRTRILDGMLERMIRAEEAKKNLSKEGAKALQAQRMRIVEDINLGIFDNDELAKRMAEKFGVKSEFTEMEREKINSLIEVLQDEGLNAVKRQVAAYKLLEVLQGELKIPVAKMLADFWVSSVLSGPNTIVSIGLAVASGAFELSTALSRVFIAGFTNQKQLPSELAGAYKTLARLLSAFGRQANIAWQYLVTGDPAFLDPSMNDVTENMQWGNIGKSNKLAEQMAKSDKILVKSAGLFMRTVSRLLTALDVFNSGLTKEGSLSIVFRQIGLDPEKIAALEKKSDLKPYKDAIIQKDFGGTPPKSARDKAIVDSYALADMMAELDKLGNVSENANFFGQQGAMTLDPSGLGGVGYRAIRSLVTNFESGSDRFLKKAQRGWSDSAQNGDQILSGLELAFAYALQFLAYNAANFGGVRFARFAGNKFNQGLSFIPGIGFARAFEAEFDPDRIRAKEAFIDSIQRNQLVGVILSIGGYYILKAIADEPDDEKRGWFINGGWGNLTPEKKQQKLAAGEKEYTIGINGKVFNYANWPISSALAAIGSLSDLIRFSPDQWKDKNVTQIMASAAMSGAAAAADIPALSQFQELFGNSLSSKDPNEKRMERFAKVMSNYAGGFVPRFLKDIDYAQDPNLRKYETLWEKTASHIPVYRRYEGKEYYDILGQQIQRNIYPGSREFMVKPTDPAYKVLGALNSRGIWLTPANAEHRMVGKGARRRSLTQEEADNYSLETGKGYKQMLLRYGQRALQMPTERAKAFLLDKADDVRDRALKKVYRGYTPAS